MSAGRADAVLLAAIGLPDVRNLGWDRGPADDDGGTAATLSLYAAVRPIKLYPGVTSPLRQTEPGIDLVIVRENLEGLFASFGKGHVDDDAVARRHYWSLIETERRRLSISRSAWLENDRVARSMAAAVVTCVDKANVFRSFAFFRRVFFDVVQRYGDIAAEAAYVDAMSLYLVQCPQRIRCAGDGEPVWRYSVGPGRRNRWRSGPGPFGRDRRSARAVSAVARHGPAACRQERGQPAGDDSLGGHDVRMAGGCRDDPIAAKVGQRITAAVERVLAAGIHLPADLGGKTGTLEVGQAVIDQLESSSS